jgi:predicted nucleic acid-binding protein
MIFIDSNILIDIATNDPIWRDWSRRQLDRCALAGDELVINDVVYAEISVRYPSADAVDDVLAVIRVGMAAIPREALFLAARAFQRYRAAGGIRTGALPDFFVGAHALVTRSALITRDPRRFRNYFPGIELIAPD